MANPEVTPRMVHCNRNEAAALQRHTDRDSQILAALKHLYCIEMLHQTKHEIAIHRVPDSLAKCKPGQTLSTATPATVAYRRFPL